MEPKSLKNISEKKLFEIINLKKPKNLPKKGLKERTLWVVIKKLREKMKNEGGDYSDLLWSLQECSYYYDDSWRSCIFALAKEKANQDLLKKDRKLRNEMIKEEAKAKKYLWKNDFDPMKGFLEFFHELNKSLFFQLSRKYEVEVEEFSERIIDETWYLKWQDVRDLKKILVKTLVNDRTNFEAVRFFQEISERQNQDFDEVINMLLTARDLVGINLS